jgi:hypothetical protein
MNQFNDSMTETEWENFGPWLKDMLKVSPATITFTKKDGTERVMQCTLDATLLPPAPINESGEPKKKRAVNDNTMAVYDLEAKAWRSFTIRSVTQLEFKSQRADG